MSGDAVFSQKSESPPPLPPKAASLCHSTEAQLTELRRKFELALSAQAAMEQELRDKDEMLAANAREIRQMRHERSQVDEDLAQTTVDFIAKQTQWLDEVVGLNAEITQLKDRIKTQDAHALKLDAAVKVAENAAAAARAAAVRAGCDDTGELAAAMPHNGSPRHRGSLGWPDTLGSHALPHNGGYGIPSLAAVSGRGNDSCAPAPGLATLELCTELRISNEHLRSEVAELRELVDNLQDENQQFQLLLASSTINGLQQRELRGRRSTDTVLARTDTPDNRVMLLENKNLEAQVIALRLCLERLVYRLLQDRDFDRAMREMLPANRIEEFQRRLGSLCERVSAQRGGANRSPRRGGISFDWSKVAMNANALLSKSSSPEPRGGPCDQSSDSLHSHSLERVPNESWTIQTIDDIVELMPGRTVSQTGMRKFHTTVDGK